MNNAQTNLKIGYVWTICLVAACGGLLFGYDCGDRRGKTLL